MAMVLGMLPGLAAHAVEFVVAAGERVQIGDVVRVTRSGAFAKGTRYSFFVGGKYSSWRRVDDDTALLVVPAGVAPGQQWLSYTPRLTDDAVGATGIVRLAIQPERTEAIATVTATLPAKEKGTLSAGLMRVEGCGIERPAPVTLRQLRSDAETAFFRSTILAGFDRPEPPLSPLSFDDVFVIEAGSEARIVTISVAVPASWTEGVPAALEPELYVSVEQHGANDELIPEIEPLHARWNASTRELRAQPATPLRVSSRDDLTIYLGVRRKESAD